MDDIGLFMGNSPFDNFGHADGFYYERKKFTVKQIICFKIMTK